MFSETIFQVLEKNIFFLLVGIIFDTMVRLSFSRYAIDSDDSNKCISHLIVTSQWIIVIRFSELNVYRIPRPSKPNICVRCIQAAHNP